jgi:hypothetical protein
MNISNELEQVFETNKVNDLKRFMEKRERLNQYNVYIRYFYYISHYSSILTTTFAVGYIGGIICDDPHIHTVKELIWMGTCLNMFSTLLTSFEQMNKSLSKQMLRDIRNIKSGIYIDEGDLIEASRKSTDYKVSVSNDD